MSRAAGLRWRSAISSGVALLLALMVAPMGASAHPGHDYGQGSEDALGFRVNSPEDLAGFFPAVQWGGTGEIDDQTADLVYAGTGCTPASYVPVADRIRGSIAIVDSRVSATNEADRCPTFTFAQKVQSAQQAGAIGFVHIPGEGESPRSNATAIHADIPALEVERTDAILAVRDAVIGGTAVNVTFTKPENFPAMSDLACVDGKAGPFPCEGIDLLAFVPQEDFNGAGISDLWGWTDPETGDEYVIIGKTNGVAFFRVTEPTSPEYLGELPNEAVLQQIWHDIKVYKNHAFIVSESEPHGMTVFDLTRLRGVDEPRTWDRDGFYPLNYAAHNVAINEESGYAYIVGGNEAIVVPDQCLSGLHMVDIRDPKNPAFAGCYMEEGGPGTAARVVGGPVQENSPAAYVHDAQCVIYRGPDTEHHGKEICFNFAENKVVIVDVTDKLRPVTLGVTAYDHVAYSHQGWLTADQAFVLANDELDETDVEAVTNTRTIVLDVRDLDAPKQHFIYQHETRSIDHNNYVHEGLAYQSNYTTGLRVLDAAGVADKFMERVAFFDTYPRSDDPTFDGTWSNYPFFASGTIAVSGIDEGLFLVRLQGDDAAAAGVDLHCDDCQAEIRAGESGSATVGVTNTGGAQDTYALEVGEVPAGWDVAVEPEVVTVSPGEHAHATVTIDVPRRARAGTYTFTVTATSSNDASVSDSETVTVEVRKGRPSDAGPPESAGRPEADSSGGGTSPVRLSAPRAASSSTPPAAGLPSSMAAMLLAGLGAATLARVLWRRRARTGEEAGSARTLR